jgi:hypothetical protein
LKLGLTRLVVLIAVAALAAGTAGCGDKKKKTTKTEVETEQFLLDAEDFDLETVVGLLKADKVKSAEELEQRINEDNGISNVDIDQDKEVDYVMVKESRDGEAIVLDMMAVPSSTNSEEDAETIATVNFKRTESSQEMHVEGGYPEYVNGHHHHYYSYRHHYGPSLSGMLFYSWLYSSRPYYYRPYMSSYYVSRPLYARSSLASKRSTYRTTSKVSPVAKKAKPSSYKSSAAAKKTTSRLSKGTSTAGKKAGIKNYKSASKTYSKRDSFKKKRQATGFGSSGKKSSGSKSVWGSSSGKKKSGASSGSRSRSRSSGFGKSSGSRSRSSGFGSSSSSRSRSRSSGGRLRR